jgi:hypothetical protein
MRKRPPLRQAQALMKSEDPLESFTPNLLAKNEHPSTMGGKRRSSDTTPFNATGTVPLHSAESLASATHIPGSEAWAEYDAPPIANP